ncbi:MAG: phosphatase PAP2 family protein [Chlorobi bacterium]|nr:phosphatase PAP2 family protein [Chlorobiota bacterium]
MTKYILNITCLIFLVVDVFSQDTINFKLFDSVKSVRGNGIISTINPDPDNFDVRLFRTINNSRSPFKDKFFNVFDRSMLPVSLILPASLLIYGRAKEKTYDENSAYLLTAAEFTNMLLTFGTKLVVNRKRPLETLPSVYTKGMPTLDVYSFPSGHASTTFSIATMFTLRYPKYPQVYAPMYAYALIVAYGRPYFGMHYPSDLLAGAIYGAGSSVLIYSLRKELFKLKNNVLNEDKNDDGSIQAGVVTFFASSFIASSIVNTFIFKPSDTKRLFVSPWINNKTRGLRVDWRF